MTKTDAKSDLTQIEADTLRMMVGGMTDAEIAFALEASKDVIKTRIAGIFNKLAVTERSDAVTAAIRWGLVKVSL